MQIGEFALDAGNLLDAQDRAPADHLALGFDRPARKRGQHCGKPDAARAQRLDRRFHYPRLVRFEPGAEGEHPMRRGAGDESGISDDVRHLGAGRPGHQELGLGAQQRMHPIDLALERDCFVVGGGLAFGEAAAGAHEADRRHHRKAQNRQQQREPGHIVAVKLRQGRDEDAEC